MAVVALEFSFAQAVAPLSPRERDLLTVLALAQPMNISRFVEVANAAGIMETPRRKLSTVTLRQFLEPLQAAALIDSGSGTFVCEATVRHQALRLAAKTANLEALAQRIRPVLYFQLYRYRDPVEAVDALAFDARVALARNDPSLVPGLEKLVGMDRADVVQGVCQAALCEAFDQDWFSRFQPAVQDYLLGHVLRFVEMLAAPVGELYPYLSKLIGSRPLPAAAVSALGGIAILRGDLGLTLQLAAQVDATSTIALELRGAAAVVEGNDDRAIALFEASGKRPGPYAGVPSVLHVVALVRRGRREDLDLATRVCAAGVRKGNRFRESFQFLTELIALRRNPLNIEFPDRAFRTFAATDCLSPWTRMMLLLWAKAADLWVTTHLGPIVQMIEAFLGNGFGWIARETQAAALAVTRMSNAPSAKYLDHLAAMDARLPPMRARPLSQLHVAKATWELALEGLERLVDAPSEEDSGTLTERIIWRVATPHFAIEPYVQKHGARTWTTGRKLALKNLLPGGSHAKGIPDEDARVAAFVREERHSSWGYGQVSCSVDPEAWRVLVGHPRVFLDGDNSPIEVVRGAAQVVANARDGALVVTVDPPDLLHPIEVRHQGGRLVVYTPDEPARAVIKLVGKGLRIPEASKARALETLGKIARVIPILTSEQTDAESVPPDPRPWLRLVPQGVGVSLRLSVRPLGSEGPHVAPGRGSVTLLGRVQGKPVQTRRDLSEEKRLAEEVVRECRVLEGMETGEDAWAVTDPGDCLELMSALRTLEARVNVEWPHGKAIALRARVGRGAMRGALRHEKGFFLATGTLAVDAELSVELEELLALVAESPGRFVRLSSGEYLELEEQLREVLETLAAARSESQGRSPSTAGIRLPSSALSALERLTEEGAGFSLDKGAAAWRTQVVTAFEKQFTVPRALSADLRDYQVEGFRWMARLAEVGLGGCLADDMGLGKTVQIIALLLHRAKLGPALVVAPTSVCDNWLKEMHRFATSLRPRLLSGPDREQQLKALGPLDVVVTSYALLQQDIDVLEPLEWATVVLDEAQLIKNAETLRAQAACRLKAPVRIACTGTPVENHVGDLYSIFRFVMPDLLGSWPRFSARFGGSHPESSAGRRSLKRILQPFLLRRTKAQVLDDLPPITEIQHTVALSAEEAKLYEAVRRSAVAKLATAGADPGSRIQMLAEITRLRRLCCHPALAFPDTSASSSKLESFLELMEELVENRHRALVFSQFVDVLQLAKKILESKNISYQYLDGSTPPKQRAAAVEAFQAGEGDAFLISLKAGGFGLNLTGADYVIHLDPWWNPAVEAQASNRAHRIGQTRPVTVYRLVCAGTVEARIVQLHAEKRDLADSLLGDTDRAATLSAEDLRSLLDE